MILNKKGEIFISDKGVKFVIGEKIKANDKSDFSGFEGYITEIRDGDDKETENKTIDIYCDFIHPECESEIECIEKLFSKLVNKSMKIEDIGFDSIIMSPDMICHIKDEIFIGSIIVALNGIYRGCIGYVKSFDRDDNIICDFQIPYFETEICRILKELGLNNMQAKDMQFNKTLFDNIKIHKCDVKTINNK